MNSEPLRARGGVVDALSSALDQGGRGLSNAPLLLHRLLSDEAWREFETVRGEVVRHERFIDFVVTPPLKGLGTEADMVRRIVRDRPETLDLFDKAMQMKAGRPKGTLYNIQGLHPSGTSREAGLRRLRKDRPDLHEEVLAGRLTTHAAMVQAGFRRRSLTVPVDRPEQTARALKRNLEPEAVAELVRLLSQDV